MGNQQLAAEQSSSPKGPAEGFPFLTPTKGGFIVQKLVTPDPGSDPPPLYI